MTEPIRILHVVVNMNRGGAETLIMNLYRNIDRTKFQFDFLTFKEGVFDKEILELGGKIYRISYVNDVGHFGYQKELDRFFSDHQSYKIVHSHMDKMSGYVLKSAAKYKIPVRIAHSHSTKSEGHIINRVYKWFAGRLLLNNLTNKVACSKLAGNWLFNGKSNDIYIVKNGIDLGKFSYSEDIRQAIRNELEIDEKTLAIGHVGRFSHPKNHAFLLEIFFELLKTRPNCKLVLVGEGKLRKEIEKKAANLGIADKVFFLGLKENIHEIMQAFDVFCFPSLYEGFPVTLIEAQALGLPCLISENISKEISICKNNVSFVELGKASVWVEKINKINNKYSFSDPQFSNNLVKSEGYDISDSARDIQIYYNQLIKQRINFE